MGAFVHHGNPPTCCLETSSGNPARLKKSKKGVVYQHRSRDDSAGWCEVFTIEGDR